jgi:hypothetical protein
LRATKKHAEANPPLIYYAPGGGLGHLTRGIAILRQWRKRTGRPALLLSYSPFAPLARKEGISVREIPGPDAGALKRILDRAGPRALVVDTFARGIMGEMADLVPSLDIPTILIQRYLNPAYLRQFNVTAFVGRFYRLVVRLADALPPQTLSQQTVDVPPVTIRETRELPPVTQRAGWLFVDWGEGSEPFIQAAQEAAVRQGKTLRVARPAESYPAVDQMVGHELVMGAGGYNLYHEAALTGTPTIFVPGRRMYDDQFARTAAAVQARTPAALGTLLQGFPPEPLPSHSGEGAAAAVAVIQALLAAAEKPAPRPVSPAARPKPAAPKKAAVSKKPAPRKAAASKKPAPKKAAVSKKPALKKAAVSKKPAPKKAAASKKPAPKKKRPSRKAPSRKRPAARKTTAARKTAQRRRSRSRRRM